MKIIEPSVAVTFFPSKDYMQRLERAGRTCYKSEKTITEESSEAFVRGIIKRGHLSVIEHESIQMRIVGDRGFTHELVRHRIASFSQESTRFCNYGAEKFGKELTFIRPFFFGHGGRENYDDVSEYTKWFAWRKSCEAAEENYLTMLACGAQPQEARSVLPNSLKTEIVMTANLREWRSLLILRCSPAAHPQMRQIMIPTLLFLQDCLPAIFGDIEYDACFRPEDYAQVKFEY